ncbi:MAG: N-acetylneuraminate synthase family protein [Phycisphaerae bacterium]|nr:N-acetylneuraminate synthase family protein [Phycisphaerae bacterium]
MNTMRIGERIIGRGHPTFIIAEIGVNHDGSVDRALELAGTAADCGADAVKLQIFRADQLMHGGAGFAEYQRQRISASNPAEMLRRYELSDSDLLAIVNHIRERNLVPLATPFSISDVERIETLDLPAIKIASPDIVNRPLIRRAMRAKRPMLISTGAATIGEVGRCVDWTLGNSVALLHCISSYPVEVSDAHLAWIRELSVRFNVPMGYSDHTIDENAGAFAVAAGACVIEKHLTYDCSATGPDHTASADPAAFARYVRAIRRAEQWMGSGPKRVLPAETDVRSISRQSLVLARAVHAGERIRAEFLLTQRPASGISAADLDDVVGRFTNCDLPAGTMLQWDMIASVADERAA